MSDASEPSHNLFPRLRIVLVETSHPGNIGAAARAMKNMGICHLVLVKPYSFPDDKATWRSASANDVLETAQVVETLDEAITGCQLVIGTSARDRRIPWPMLDPKGCGQRVQAEHDQGAEVALLFGREAHGLKNEELQKCHYHVNIPTGEAYSSLNLAMAVQVLCYEVLQARLYAELPEHVKEEQARAELPANQKWDRDFATTEEIENFFVHLEQTLVDVEFLDPDNPRQLMTRLRRMFNRIRTDEMEVNILRGFLTAIQQKLGKR